MKMLLITENILRYKAKSIDIIYDKDLKESIVKEMHEYTLAGIDSFELNYLKNINSKIQNYNDENLYFINDIINGILNIYEKNRDFASVENENSDLNLKKDPSFLQIIKIKDELNHKISLLKKSKNKQQNQYENNIEAFKEFSIDKSFDLIKVLNKIKTTPEKDLAFDNIIKELKNSKILNKDKEKLIKIQSEFNQYLKELELNVEKSKEQMNMISEILEDHPYLEEHYFINDFEKKFNEFDNELKSLDDDLNNLMSDYQKSGFHYIEVFEHKFDVLDLAEFYKSLPVNFYLVRVNKEVVSSKKSRKVNYTIIDKVMPHDNLENSTGFIFFDPNIFDNKVLKIYDFLQYVKKDREFKIFLQRYMNNLQLRNKNIFTMDYPKALIAFNSIFKDIN